MDSYDLFGDDVSGSVLDGLPDLGSEAFGDSSATGPGPSVRDPGGGSQQQVPYGSHGGTPSGYPSGPSPATQQQPQAQGAAGGPPPVGGAATSESPLQKLATFGDYSTHQQQPQHHMDPYGGGHYDPSRPMVGGYPMSHELPPQAPPPQQSRRGRGHSAQQQQQQQQQQQYPGYGEGMYPGAGMEAAAAGSAEHMPWQGMPYRSQSQQQQQYQMQAGYGRHQQMGYEALGQQKQPPMGQYGGSNSAMMGSQLMPTQQQQQQGQYSVQQQQQQQRMMQQQQNYPEAPASSGQMYPGGQQGSYPGGYGQSAGHQRFPYQQYPQQPKSKQQVQQQQQQQHELASYNHQMPHHHQYQQPHSGMGHYPQSSKHPGMQQPGPPPSMGGASPQYRAPYPQLSPQMSPRPPQMSPRPPQPSSKLSPHHQHLTSQPSMSPGRQPPSKQQQLNQPPGSSPGHMYPGMGQAPSTLQALEQMVMPPSSSEYPSSAGAYSRQSQQQQQQQSGPSPGMIPSPMQQANMSGRNPLSPQPWPQQRQQQAPGHMSGPATPQQQTMASQQQMNGGMMSGGTMQEIPSSQSGMPHHLTVPPSSMDTEAHMTRPRSQDAQSAQQTVPDPSSEGDSRRPPDQSEFSLDKFVESKEHAADKQEEDKPKQQDAYSTPDFGAYQGDSSNSQPPKSDSESYQATPPPAVSAAGARPSSRPQSSNGMAANGPPPPHSMGMGMSQMGPHGMSQAMAMGGPPHSMPPSMHPSMQGPGGMHMMGPPGHMMDMHGGYMPTGPMGHQQEMAALQQQLQEFYCMPQQTPDIQSKVAWMQERLQTLQQHCATSPCMGPGAHCSLPSPMPLPSQPLGIDHIPPVPTTGRGRGKGSRGQRKPRGGGGKRGAKHQAQIPGPYDMMPPSNGELMSHLPPYAQQPPPPHMGMSSMAPHSMDPMGGMGPMHHMPPGMPPAMQMQLQHGGIQGSPAHAMMQQGVHPGQQNMPPGPPMHPGPPPGIPPMPPPQGMPPQMQQLPPPQGMPPSIGSPLPPPHMVPTSPGLPQGMQPPPQQQQPPAPPQAAPMPTLQPPPEQLEHHEPPPPPPPMPMPSPIEEEQPPVMATAPPPLEPPETLEEISHQMEESAPLPEQPIVAPLPEPMETLQDSSMEPENSPAPPDPPPMPTDLFEAQEQPAIPVEPPQSAPASMDEDPYSIEEFDEKQKKPKTPRKPREPKKPKEPKVPKEPKEKKSKKKDDGEEGKSKSRKSRKKKDSEQESSVPEEESKDDHSIDAASSEMKESESPSDTPTQEDEIKTEVKAEGEEPSESSAPATPAKKETKKRVRPPKGVVAKRNRSLKSMIANKGKKGRRGLIGKDSDGPSDMEGTPPPSPPPEDDSVHKRRSARNTQRKKYTDDIELSISDEEIPGNLILDSNASTPKGGSKVEAQSPDESQGGASTPAAPGTPTASSTSGGGKKAKVEEEQQAADSNVKPNFVYINTGDEDSMVVQIVLAMRTGKRPRKKPEVPAVATDQEGEKKTDEKSDPDQESDAIKPEPKKDDESQGTEEKEKEEDDDKADNDKTVQQHKFHLDEVAAAEDMEEVEEYFVKYRSFSYLHCEWRTEEELIKGDKRVSAKLKRFKQKQAQQCNIFETLDEEPFNPDYTEVDRVLDVTEHEDPNGSGAPTKHYLVKWRSLQYEDSTWELEEDVDPEKIQNYLRWQKIPPKEQWKPKKRPRPEDWKKLNESPVYKNGNKLREYQLEGLNWLLFSWYNNRNCILADEMGLGKTIQSLTFIHAVHQYGIRGPFLVVAPLSTIPNWQREFEAWTDLNVVVYHGSSASRNMLTEYEVYFKDAKGNPIKDVTKFNVLITTFEIIISDVMELRPFNWRLCVIDEAHRLKNRNCKLLEGLRLLNLEHRVLLSGTPLQNNVNELFSLLNFLEPTQFSSSESFLEEFGQLKDETEVQKLQVLLKPMMLRRLKEDVEKSIAPKEETVIEVELTNIQKKYYRAILERNFSFLSKGTTSANVPSLMNTMMELRKCCIHPYLLNGAEDQIHIEFRQAQGEDPDAYYKALIQSSGKMVLVDKLLPKLKANGHRVLVFSQMVRCLDILEDYLVYRKYPFERIDGRIRGNLRQAAIDRFSKPDSDRFVFLLCTKAGGLGINLTAADTVIIYDSDWNPQNDLQAQARCHRIGQQKMVKVYRLLCRNTYEREMFDKASLKLGLDKAVLQSMNTAQGGKDQNSKQLTKKEIEDLLKKGAYGAIMDEDEGDKFCEEDIDQILERRTQVITLESEKGSTFSKASFASSGIRSDIDIDDPDFWVKWAKKADIDMKDGNDHSELVISEPRRRTQIKRYGQDESMMDMSELDSSSDSDEDGGVRGTRSGRKHKTKFGRIKARRYEEYTEGDVVYGSWSRSECFKVEKGLLTYGWGRWNEILMTSQFRQGWRESDVEDLARVIVLYCLRMFRGDEKLRQFSWDLVTPPEFATDKAANQLSSGRGRKSKKRPVDDTSQDWSRDEKYDGDIFLEGSYKKHLFRHSTKVLLRIRMLHYIKHDIVGELAQQISDGVALGHLPLAAVPPPPELPPTVWWGPHDDQSLVVGVYKHGYENYALMRADPCLSFLATCGPPSKAELEAQGTQQTKRKQITDEELSKISDDDEAEAEAAELEGEHPVEGGGDKAPWPSVADLNTRLRRVISSYQRNFKREEMKLAQRAKNEKREKMEQLLRGRHHHAALEAVRRWSRREEAEFFRTVSTFGVEYDRKRGQYDWNKFRAISHLERKQDEAMTEYYRAFCTMLKRVCGMKLTEDEELLDIVVDPISEEKARRTLERLDLLNKVREETIFSPNLEERLKLCQSSTDLPEWWIPGKHDKELLLGAAKHGLGRTDVYILNDADFSFRDVLRLYASGQVPAHVRSAARKAEESEVKKSKEEQEAAMGAIKLERPEDILRIDKDEIIVKLEKGEGTLKIEKIGMKKDTATATATSAAPSAVKEEKDEVELTIVAPKPGEDEAKVDDEGTGKPAEEPAEESVSKEETEKPKSPAEKEKPEEEAEKKEETEQQPETASTASKEVQEEDDENKEKKLDEEEKMEVEEEKKPEDKAEETEAEKPLAEVEKSKPETGKKEKKSKKDRAAEKAAVEDSEKPEPRCTRRKSQAAAAAAAAEARAKSIDSKPKTPDAIKEEEKAEDLAAGPEKETEPEKMDVDEKPEEKKDEEEKADKPEEAEEDKKQDEPSQEKEKEPVIEEKDSEKPEEKIDEPEKPAVVKEKEQAPPAEVPLPPPDLKALFPDLEVIQPLSKLAELDTYVFRDKRDFPGELSLAHILAAQGGFHSKFSWPKDNILQSRLEQVVIAVDTNEWPPPRPIPPFPSDLEIFANTPPGGTPRRDTPTLSLEEQQLADLHGVMMQHAHQQGLSMSRASAMAAAALASKKRKRQHIAIDVETERAKLHALLQNSGHLPASKLWDEESLSEESRRSTPNQSALGQPPPAHQNTSSRVLNMPLSSFELKFHTGASSSAVAAAAAKGGLLGPTLIPGTSSTLTPIDLSSGFYHSLPKMECPTSTALDVSRSRGGDDGSGEAPQDFSLPSKNKKSRLDDMLDKLMKRKQEEPTAAAGGKEKKRRKLDEIVMGLSSAKAEQQQAAHAGVAELIKKTAATISVVGGTNTSPAHQQPPSHLPPPPGGATLHPLLRPHVHKGAPTPSNHPPISSASKPPFTITVTSVPSSAASSSSRAPPPPMPPISSAACKDTFSLLPQPDLAASIALLTGATSGKKGSSLGMSLPSAHSKMSSSAAAAAAYEAVLADMNKMADLSAKVNSYSQEAKVKKWLSEQSSLVNNELTADFLARRRKPRQDQTPPVLDWKKITGEENIPVINRSTGKKLTGSKAPSLKQLGQWLLENPMFEIDPKWNEMLKEMGNFPSSVPKRGSGSGQQSSSSAAAGSSSGQSSSKKSSSSRSAQQASTSDASSLAAAAMGLPFNPSLAALSGLNPSLLSSLGLGGFDPKNPLAGFDPKTLGFDPKSLGFDPKSLGFDPKSLGFDPKSLGFDPKTLGFDPKALGFDPKSLGFDPKNPLGAFDPKNPLLLPAFAAAAGSMPGMSGLAGLSGFGGLSSNLFANLASLGFGLDGSEGQAASASAGSSKSKSRSSAPKESKSSLAASQAAAVSSASASIPTSSLNLFFPNPSLLYTPLGLGGLNPFGSSPSSLSSAYDNLMQQSQLLNGMGGTSGAATSTTSSKGHRSSGQSSSSSASNHKRASSALEKQQQQIQRLLIQQQLDAANELARAQLEKAAKAAEEEPKSGRHKTKSRSQGLGSLTKLEETVSKLAERKGLRNKASREGSEEKEATMAAAPAAAEPEADQPPDEKQPSEEEKATEEEA